MISHVRDVSVLSSFVATTLVHAIVAVAQSNSPIVSPNESSTAYIRQERIVRYGKKGNDYVEISDRRDLAVSSVKFEDGIYRVDEMIDARLLKDRGRAVMQERNRRNLLNATFAAGIRKGRAINWPKTSFNPEVPRLGFEYFYVPFDISPDSVRNRQGVRILSTQEHFSPRFRGQWAYRFEEKEHGVFALSGPFAFSTKDDHVRLTGTYEHLLQANPMTFKRMSGECQIVFRPATEIVKVDNVLWSKESAEETAYFKQFDEILIHHTFLMVEFDSPESKRLKLPEELQTHLETLNAGARVRETDGRRGE